MAEGQPVCAINEKSIFELEFVQCGLHFNQPDSPVRRRSGSGVLDQLLCPGNPYKAIHFSTQGNRGTTTEERAQNKNPGKDVYSSTQSSFTVHPEHFLLC